jgi:hypothetical protein
MLRWLQPRTIKHIACQSEDECLEKCHEVENALNVAALRIL